MLSLKRITTNPNVMQGKPCIRGMRISVSLVINLVANGMSHADILRNYPDLEEEDIEQSLRYAAYLADERVMPIEETHRAVSG